MAGVAIVAAAGVLWIFLGPAAPDDAAGNAQVVGALFAAAALVIAALQLGDPAPAARVADLDAAEAHLGSESLRAWEREAGERGLVHPQAVVRGAWGDQDVAVPFHEILPALQAPLGPLRLTGPPEITAGAGGEGPVTDLLDLHGRLRRRTNRPVRIVVLGEPVPARPGRCCC